MKSEGISYFNCLTKTTILTTKSLSICMTQSSTILTEKKRKEEEPWSCTSSGLEAELGCALCIVNGQTLSEDSSRSCIG